jgi:hypothetical protein
LHVQAKAESLAGLLGAAIDNASEQHAIVNMMIALKDHMS